MGSGRSNLLGKCIFIGLGILDTACPQGLTSSGPALESLGLGRGNWVKKDKGKWWFLETKKREGTQSQVILEDSWRLLELWILTRSSLGFFQPSEVVWSGEGRMGPGPLPSARSPCSSSRSDMEGLRTLIRGAQSHCGACIILSSARRAARPLPRDSWLPSWDVVL